MSMIVHSNLSVKLRRVWCKTRTRLGKTYLRTLGTLMSTDSREPLVFYIDMGDNYSFIITIVLCMFIELTRFTKGAV
jgi:hypothetical protein